MTRTRIVLLGTLAVVASVYVYQGIDEHLERHARLERGRESMKRSKDAEVAAARLPLPDYAMQSQAGKSPEAAIESAWQLREMAFFENLLANGQFDVLVVPFQVEQNALDRPTRSLMSAQLAIGIAAAQSVKVPDPYLVARALGDGARRFKPESVYRLARKLGVRRIVWGYVGHSSKAMSLLIGSQERDAKGLIDANTQMAVQRFSNIAFSDEDPPILVYQTLLPGVLKAIGVGAPAPESAGAAVARNSNDLVPTPLDAARSLSDPAADARFLQLMAALTPTNADRIRERLVEKSLLAVLRMPADSPDYRVLKARTLMQLGLRPAALRTLGAPATAEENHLQAMLNGNLPDVERFAPQVKPKVNALIAQLELNAIATAFDSRTSKQSAESASSLGLPGRDWPFLAARAFTDWDRWSQFDNMAVKRALDRDFPLADFTAESLLRGTAMLGDLDKLQAAVDLSVAKHVRRVLETHPTDYCCKEVGGRLTPLEYLDFLDSIALDNLMRRAELRSMQDLPDDEMKFLAQIESEYADHPQFAVAHSRAKIDKAKRAERTEQEHLRKSAYIDALHALYWEHGQTHASSDAVSIYFSNQLGAVSLFFPDLYGDDYPCHPFYTWLGDPAAAIRMSAIDYYPVRFVTHNFGGASGLAFTERTAESIRNRFIGHPERAVLLARISAAKGDEATAERLYREALHPNSAQWDLYAGLGRLLFEDARIEQAAKIFAAYPGFRKGSGVNSVDLSNHAYFAGSLFYWSGNFERAAPLYRIAAELETGSDASLSSDIRLRLLDNDYVGAMVMSLQRAQRYHSEFAYRDYLGLLHATGHSKEAWDAFGTLIAQIDTPQVWETALVGHRLEGATEAQIAAWAAQGLTRNGGRDFAFAPTYLVRAAVTDRMPTSELASLIAGIDRPVWQYAGHIERESADGKKHAYLHLSPDGTPVKPSRFPVTSKRIPVKSDLVYFVEGYRAMRLGDFAAARATFQESAELYELRMEPFNYLLPYYAYAAAKSGEISQVEALINTTPIPWRRFDYYLAKAVLSALSGKPDDALKSLQLARNRRPFTGARPLFIEYQFAETIEWLYGETHDIRYRDIALNWAKKNQTLTPWAAWTYALEAKLGATASDRRRAMAMAYYLDKNSERLGMLPAQEVKAASKAMADRNPFLPKKLETRKDAV